MVFCMQRANAQMIHVQEQNQKEKKKKRIIISLNYTLESQKAYCA